MAINEAHWQIQNDKDIRYIGPSHTATGANYITVIELHRWLQNRADDASQLNADDFMDITKDTPSDRSTDNIITLINGYNIDDTTSEYLYNGSIIQDSDATWYDGILIYSAPDTFVEIIQNGANIANDFWNSVMFNDGGINPNGYRGLNFDTNNGISHRFLVKTKSGGSQIDGTRMIVHTREWGKTFSEFKINGTSRGNNVAALTYANDLNNDESIGNMTASPYTLIANDAVGYNLMDVDNNSTDEAYYSRWDLNGAAINDLYQRMKYLTRRGETTTLYGLQGQIFRGITHEVALTTPRSGTFSAFEAVSWTGGTGQMLAIDSTTAGTKMWIQLLTGVAPSGSLTITGGTSSATATNSGTPTERPLSFPFCGQSTGSAIIGAYGFGIDELDLAATDSVTDLLTANPITPPNNVTFTMGNLVSGDRVLVTERGYHFYYDAEASGPFQVGETLTFTSPAGTAKLTKLIDRGTTGEMWIGPMLTGTVPADNSTITGGTSSATASVNGTVTNDVNFGQLKANALINGATVTSIVTSTAIPTDTPATGTIRIQRNSGTYTRHAYTSYTGSTFTIASTDFSGDPVAASNNIFVSYIDDASSGDTMSFTGVYLADRSLFFRVRNGTSGTPKIKTSEGTGTLGSAGGSANASRISDE